MKGFESRFFGRMKFAQSFLSITICKRKVDKYFKNYHKHNNSNCGENSGPDKKPSVFNQNMPDHILRQCFQFLSSIGMFQGHMIIFKNVFCQKKLTILK